MKPNCPDSRVRVFVAVPVPETVQGALGDIVRQLNETGADVRWVKPGSVHLTLLFIGEVPGEEIPAIADGLREATKNLGRFTLECRGVGAFPSERRPRVWWAGIAASVPLSDLAERVRHGLEWLGIRDEGRGAFRPHLTIGRVRSLRGAEKVRGIAERLGDRSFGVIPVNKISLMRSTLRPQGALHTEIVPITLEGRSPAGKTVKAVNG